MKISIWEKIWAAGMAEGLPEPMSREKSSLLKMAATNRMYARACRETYEESGRLSALNQAELHEACAMAKEAQARDL